MIEKWQDNSCYLEVFVKNSVGKVVDKKSS